MSNGNDLITACATVELSNSRRILGKKKGGDESND